MTIPANGYVPIIKWRMGEYQSLLKLKPATKQMITPLIVVPPREWDFEAQIEKKTVEEHIEPFTRRLHDKWGKSKAMIDLHESLKSATDDSGNFVLSRIFGEILTEGGEAIPVCSLADDASYLALVRQIAASQGLGVCLRVRLAELVDPALNSMISAVISQVAVTTDQVDLVIDLQEPDNFEPLDIFASLLSTKCLSISGLGTFRSFVVAGMSLKLSEIKKPGDEVPRLEWLLYKKMVDLLEIERVPTFGDYSIETPKFSSEDMRLMKPAGKIVYTCDETWIVVKGGAFREDNSQMVGHCQTITTSGRFSGPLFSAGDKRIEDTATGAEGCGNQTTWKQVGVNHHLEKVVDQLSSFHV